MEEIEQRKGERNKKSTKRVSREITIYKRARAQRERERDLRRFPFSCKDRSSEEGCGSFEYGAASLGGYQG